MAETLTEGGAGRGSIIIEPLQANDEFPGSPIPGFELDKEQLSSFNTPLRSETVHTIGIKALSAPEFHVQNN